MPSQTNTIVLEYFTDFVMAIEFSINIFIELTEYSD